MTVSIEDNIEKLYKPEAVTASRQNLECSIEQTKKMILKRQQTQKDISDQKMVAEQALTDFREEMFEITRQLELKSLRDIESQCCELNDVISFQNESLKQDLRQAEDMGTMFYGAEKLSAVKEFVCSKLADDLVNRIQENSLPDPATSKITFISNKTVKKLLLSMQSLGIMDIEDAPETRKTKVYKVTTIEKINIHVDDDKEEECCVKRACVMPDGTILIVERDNSRIKRLTNRDYPLALRDYLDLPGDPRSLCVINHREVAVTFPVEQRIQFVSLGETMELGRTIQVDFKCTQVLHHAGILYVSEFGNRIYMYKLSGERIKQLTWDYFAGSLLLSPDGLVLYICACSDFLFAVNSQTLEFIWQCREGFRYAADICSDGSGSLFVCGSSSTNIVQIRENGEVVRELVGEDDGLKKIIAVCYDPLIGRMIVLTESCELMVVQLEEV